MPVKDPLGSTELCSWPRIQPRAISLPLRVDFLLCVPDFGYLAYILRFTQSWTRSSGCNLDRRLSTIGLQSETYA